MRNLPEDEKLVIIWLILFFFYRKSADFKLLVFSRKQTVNKIMLKLWSYLFLDIHYKMSFGMLRPSSDPLMEYDTTSV